MASPRSKAVAMAATVTMQRTCSHIGMVQSALCARGTYNGRGLGAEFELIMQVVHFAVCV